MTATCPWSSLRRRMAILDLLASEGPRPAAELRPLLRPAVAERTLFKDLEWLARHFPEQVQREKGADARQGIWRLSGFPPVLLPQPISTMTADELTALIAARGMLRAPDTRSPGWERPSTAYDGDLSRALHGLIERCGLADEAATIAPGTLGVSRFGVATEAPGALATLERALRTGRSVSFRYRSRGTAERDVHVWPIRQVLLKGEWFCFAWAPDDGRRTDAPATTSAAANATATATGKVKQYALSRITSREPSVRIERTLPRGAPIRPPRDEVDAILATGFHATGGGKHTRVVLVASPRAWPFIADRVWGEGQAIDQPADDLTNGWHRITFSTTGLEECRHWVMSLGAEVRVEAPPELRTWLAEQARALLDYLGSEPPPVAAPAGAVIGDRVRDTTLND